MAERIRDAIEVRLRELENMPIAKLVERRQERLLSYGEFEG
jgi:acetyl-CoA carboxylase carboxyl transferase subunit alpha